ncbi:U11/U12 small nuclear ribonucleoprotein 35 kDa protein [Trichoplax sp. H2]|nr:U11/U12 small nuclear ribonucleoprotein 35 kDa protein [Trichoplax sp. H2]|eukprot:RDD45468.1 U11/U12 small nuclear ribonucleoprotein 35 kDa protein [Trichoplax sp. H2]
MAEDNTFDNWVSLFSHRGSYDPLRAGSIDGTDSLAHDRAVIRAMTSRYKPNTLVATDPNRTLFIGRLNPKTTEDTLMKIFSKYGKIKSCRLVRDVVTGISRRYAFIEFCDDKSYDVAFHDANKMMIDSSEIIVEHEYERKLKGWIPRRLGGGIGGKKESGQLRFGGRDRPFRRPIHVFREDSGKFKQRSQDSYSRDDHNMSSSYRKDRKSDSYKKHSSFNRRY